MPSFCLSKKIRVKKEEIIKGGEFGENFGRQPHLLVQTAPGFVLCSVLVISRSWGYMVHPRYSSAQFCLQDIKGQKIGLEWEVYPGTEGVLIT